MKKLKVETALEADSIPPIQPLSSFCRKSEIGKITAWRHRKRGWLITVNIGGRPYITGQAVKDYISRAEAGEFFKAHCKAAQTPSKKAAVA